MHAQQGGTTHTLIRSDSNIEDQIRGKWASQKTKGPAFISHNEHI
jgi:hypothetical protein